MDGTDGDGSDDRAQNPYTTMLAILGGGLAIALVVIAIGFAVGGGDGGGEDAAGGGAPVPVSLTEFAISGDLQVAPGGSLAVTNDGSQIHNLVIEGDGQTADLGSGESENLTVDVPEGEYVGLLLHPRSP